MSSGDISQSYYNYISDYVKSEIDNNFEYSIDDFDNSLLYKYSDAVMGRICENISGINNNPEISECIFHELLLASQIGFVLNSATKRFGLEDPEFGAFIQQKKNIKYKYTLKEKVIIFLLKILNKKITVVG